MITPISYRLLYLEVRPSYHRIMEELSVLRRLDKQPKAGTAKLSAGMNMRLDAALFDADANAVMWNDELRNNR